MSTDDDLEFEINPELATKGSLVNVLRPKNHMVQTARGSFLTVGSNSFRMFRTLRRAAVSYGRPRHDPGVGRFYFNGTYWNRGRHQPRSGLAQHCGRFRLERTGLRRHELRSLRRWRVTSGSYQRVRRHGAWVRGLFFCRRNSYRRRDWRTRHGRFTCEPYRWSFSYLMFSGWTVRRRFSPVHYPDRDV